MWYYTSLGTHGLSGSRHSQGRHYAGVVIGPPEVTSSDLFAWAIRVVSMVDEGDQELANLCPAEHSIHHKGK